MSQFARTLRAEQLFIMRDHREVLLGKGKSISDASTADIQRLMADAGRRIMVKQISFEQLQQKLARRVKAEKMMHRRSVRNMIKSLKEKRELERNLNSEQKRREYEIMKEQERLRLRRPMERPMTGGGMAM